jgi:thiamine pyrophosphate-dependent acetolactate synthase large subunit-like protein
MVMLQRRAAAAILLANRTDELLLVTGLGSTTWDAAAVGENDRDFYLWGAMGGAAMVGLGIALAQPQRRVLVLTGDGEMLMGLGSIATIGRQRPGNLAVVVFDNGVYGETGMQPSHTQANAAAGGADLIAVASACGIGITFDVRNENELGVLAAELTTSTQTLFARVRIEANDPPRILPTRDGVTLKCRFRRAIAVD